MEETLPKCPWCKTDKHVRIVGHRRYYCSKCGREFDGVDDGTITYGRPSKRLEREERMQSRKAVR